MTLVSLSVGMRQNLDPICLMFLSLDIQNFRGWYSFCLFVFLLVRIALVVTQIDLCFLTHQNYHGN